MKLFWYWDEKAADSTWNVNVLSQPVARKPYGKYKQCLTYHFKAVLDFQGTFRTLRHVASIIEDAHQSVSERCLQYWRET